MNRGATIAYSPNLNHKRYNVVDVFHCVSEEYSVKTIILERKGTGISHDIYAFEPSQVNS
jgi:hypothetical protein